MQISSMTLLFYLFINLILSMHVAYADNDYEKLSNCISGSITEADRKEISKWLFVCMAHNKEVSSVSFIKEEDILKAEKAAGLIMNRIITHDCKSQIESAVKNNDMSSVNDAFKYLGKVGMDELLSDQNVKKEIHRKDKYIDREYLMRLELLSTKKGADIK